MNYMEFYDSYEENNETLPADMESYNSITVVSLVLNVLTCVLGIPGNTLVVWIAGMKMKRTVNTTWFLNLAIADLLCCLSIPFSVADHFLDGHWPYGNVMCKVLPTMIVINMFASVFTLSLIGLDRFIQVVKPVWSQNNRSLGLASVCCAMAWVLALLLSLPNMIFRKTVTDYDIDMTVCTFDSGFNGNGSSDHTDGAGHSYRTLTGIRFMLGFLIPLLSITACYALIARKVSRSQFRSGRAFRIMLAVVVAFFLSWLPYHVVDLVIAYCEPKISSLAKEIDPLVVSLAYTNSCINPVLYVFMGQDFKEKVKLSMRRVFKRAFSEDGTHSSQYSKGQQSHATKTSGSCLIEHRWTVYTTHNI